MLDVTHNIVLSFPTYAAYAERVYNRLPNDRYQLTVQGKYFGPGKKRNPKIPIKSRHFWNDFAVAFGGEAMVRLWLEKFDATLRHRQFQYREAPKAFYYSFDIGRDKRGYEIGPHTDTMDKWVTTLYYLPRSLAQVQVGRCNVTSVDPLLYSRVPCIIFLTSCTCIKPAYTHEQTTIKSTGVIEAFASWKVFVQLASPLHLRLGRAWCGQSPAGRTTDGRGAGWVVTSRWRARCRSFPTPSLPLRRATSRGTRSRAIEDQSPATPSRALSSRRGTAVKGRAGGTRIGVRD